jgi:phosphoenolpyruvate---glycerone phosphotransferase subunit DhaL
MSETITQDRVVAWLRAFAEAVAENRAYLTDLDAAIGDADHGSNMDRGMQAVVAKLGEPGEPAWGDMGALLKKVGMTLVSTVGGAAGPLYGTFFLQMGKTAGEAGELSTAQLAVALEAAVKGVQMRGKAELEDKTMVDALVPAAQALIAAAASGLPLADALKRAAEAAEQGMKATIPMVARKGRASYLGERSAGHQDPGATSSWLLIQTAAETLAGDASADHCGE